MVCSFFIRNCSNCSDITNNYIFYKEYINEVSWQAPSNPLTPIAKYRIYRKLKEVADTAYQQVAEVSSSTFNYAERGLKKTTYYTYRITLEDAYGRESLPAEVSNTGTMGRAR